MTHWTTPASVVRRNAAILVVSMVAPVVFLRLALYVEPNADFDVAGYNVHHLYTGLLLVVLGGLPLALFRGNTRRLDVALAVFGVGLGLALDEWVYLIATDGSNASYLLPVSLWGAVVVIGLALLYAAGLIAFAVLRKGPGAPSAPARG